MPVRQELEPPPGFRLGQGRTGKTNLHKNLLAENMEVKAKSISGIAFGGDAYEIDDRIDTARIDELEKKVKKKADRENPVIVGRVVSLNGVGNRYFCKVGGKRIEGITAKLSLFPFGAANKVVFHVVDGGEELAIERISFTDNLDIDFSLKNPVFDVEAQEGAHSCGGNTMEVKSDADKVFLQLNSPDFPSVSVVEVVSLDWDSTTGTLTSTLRLTDHDCDEIPHTASPNLIVRKGNITNTSVPVVLKSLASYASGGKCGKRGHVFYMWKRRRHNAGIRSADKHPRPEYGKSYGSFSVKRFTAKQVEEKLAAKVAAWEFVPGISVLLRGISRGRWLSAGYVELFVKKSGKISTL